MLGIRVTQLALLNIDSSVSLVRVVLAVTFLPGCVESHRRDVLTPADVDFDTAIEIIATSNDWNYVNSAQARLSSGGLPAIDALRNHLTDDPVIPTGYTTRSINSGDITIGEQALWTIQDTIYSMNSKRYGNYFVLTESNLEQWLDRNRGKTLAGLQIEAVSTSLAHAKQEFESSRSSQSREAIEAFRSRLDEFYSSL